MASFSSLSPITRHAWYPFQLGFVTEVQPSSTSFIYPDSQLRHISAFYCQRFGNPSAWSAMLPQPFRTIGKHSGANFGTFDILPCRIRLLRKGFGFYTATFRMSLRECMWIHAEWVRWQSSAHGLISDTERFPYLAQFYRQPFSKASGL